MALVSAYMSAAIIVTACRGGTAVITDAIAAVGADQQPIRASESNSPRLELGLAFR